MGQLPKLFCTLLIVLGISLSIARVQAHDHRHPTGSAVTVQASAPTAATAATPGAVSGQGVSGQGKMKFEVLYTADHLPEEAIKVLVSAHGGFAVDRRQGKGETYFALPGAGIVQINADLTKTRMLETPGNVKTENLHNTTIWYGPDGAPYLTFPANQAGQIFTTTLEGKLVHTLNSPTAEDDFDQSAVNDYFAAQGEFAPTDVEQLDGLYT